MEKVNVFWHEAVVTKYERQILNGHKSCCIWLTGLSGSGKSTLANRLDQILFHNQVRSYVLDGDNIRHGLNKDLGFSKEDRQENIRRIGEVAKLFVDSGTITITAFISPFSTDRENVRKLFAEGDFIEVYLKCPIQACESRDPKGLYKMAREGKIRDFTGISSPYEEPVNPELTIDTNKLSLEESVEKVMNYLKVRKIIKDF